jgi:4-amino-4-deoxy-L-arabinose transferase-like glycosyltransferase
MLPKAYRIQAGDGIASGGSCADGGNGTSALYDASIVGRLKPALLILLALGLGVGLRFYFFLHWSQINGDSMVYGDIAKNWLQHGVYGRSFIDASGKAIHPTLIRLPGYPLFLAACFVLFGMEHYNAVLLLQIAIDLGTCLLIACFVWQMCSRRAAWIALYFAALCPFTANFTSAALTETLSLFFITLAMLGLLRIVTRGDALAVALCAVSWSCITLLRPDGALLPIAFFPAVIWYGRKSVLGFPAIGVRRALRLACISGLLSALPFIAWTYRNWQTFHLFQPLAPRYATDPGEEIDPGFNRWMKTWTAEFTSTYEIYWNTNSDQMPLDKLPTRAFDSPAQRAETAALLADYNQTATLTPAMDDAFGRLAADRIQANPLRYYLWLPALRVTDMWLRPRTEMLNVELRWWRYSEHHVETVFATSYGALNLFYVIAAGVGLLRWKRTGEVKLMAAMIGYLLLRDLLLATIEAPEARYTIEGFPMLIAWAAAAFARCRVCLPSTTSS